MDRFYVSGNDEPLCLASDADAAIAELKVAVVGQVALVQMRDKQIAELKHKVCVLENTLEDRDKTISGILRNESY